MTTSPLTHSRTHLIIQFSIISLFRCLLQFFIPCLFRISTSAPLITAMTVIFIFHNFLIFLTILFQICFCPMLGLLNHFSRIFSFCLRLTDPIYWLGLVDRLKVPHDNIVVKADTMFWLIFPKLLAVSYQQQKKPPCNESVQYFELSLPYWAVQSLSAFFREIVILTPRQANFFQKWENTLAD